MNFYPLYFIPDSDKTNLMLQKMAKNGLIMYVYMGSNIYGATLTKKGLQAYINI